MKQQGFVVKVGLFYMNWQCLLVEDIEDSILFTRPEDAAVVSYFYEKDNPELIPHEREESQTVGSSAGTYFEYHAAVGY